LRVPRRGVMRFRDVLEESLRRLRHEVPAAYEVLCRRLAPREVRLRVDGDDVALRFRRRDAILDVPQRPVVEVETTREAILQLVDARHTLLSAVLAEALVLRGSLDDLLAFHDGLQAYIHGAVRAPSFPKLLARYRRGEGGAQE